MHRSKTQHTNVLDTTQSKPHKRWGCSNGTRHGPIHTFQRKSTKVRTLTRMARIDGGAPRSLALCIATARCGGTCGIFNHLGQDIRTLERPMRQVSVLICIEAAKQPAYPAAVATTCWRQRPWCTASWRNPVLTVPQQLDSTPTHVLHASFMAYIYLHQGVGASAYWVHRVVQPQLVPPQLVHCRADKGQNRRDQRTSCSSLLATTCTAVEVRKAAAKKR